MNKTISYVVMWFLIASGISLGVMLTIPPKQPVALSLKQFSLENQKEHIRQMAQAPHPLGTAEHGKVKEYILAQIRGLGLSPIVQRERCVATWENGLARVAWVDNLMVRIPGLDSSGAVLLMAHYDSVPDAPGANDDAAGVASILEILRILSVSAPVKNDVIALITDGEEFGMFGAQVFFERHPWAQEVSVVLNLEARGCTGGVYMYETGANNAWLVKAFARSASSPVGNSLTHAIYQLMPNDSDFTLAKSAGLPGMNFAYIDGWYAYHTPLDNQTHLDDNTLYQHGSGILEVVNSLSSKELDILPPGDAVYFNLWRPWLISYPESWVWPLTALGMVLLAGIFLFGLLKGYLSGWGILRGFVCLGLSGGAAVAAAFALESAVRRRFAAAYPVISQYPDFRHIFLFVFLCLSIALFFLFMRWARRRGDAPSLAAGSLIWWALGAIAVTRFLPQGSFLTTWPLVFAALSLWVILSLEKPDEVSVVQVLLLGILALPALIQLSMFLIAFNTAFRLSPLSILIPVFMLGLLTPALAAYRTKALSITGTLFLVLALAGGGVGLLGLRTNERPLPQTVFYEVDGESAFLSVLERTPWAESFMEAGQEESMSFPYPVRGTVLRRTHPRLPIAAPRLEPGDVARSQGRSIRTLRISSPRRAPVVSLLLAGSEPFTAQMGTEGEKMFSVVRAEQEADAGKPHRLLIHFLAMPAQGVLLKVESEGAGPIEGKCVDLSHDHPRGLDIPAPPPTILLHPRTLAHSRTQLPGPDERRE